MKQVLMALIIGTFAFTAQSQACGECSTQPTLPPTYAQICLSKMTHAGYCGELNELCSVITTNEALLCVEGLIKHHYTDLSTDIFEGCAQATVCGEGAIQSLFSHNYTHIPGDLIGVVAGAKSPEQAKCFERVFAQGYNHLTACNIQQLCP